MNRDQFISEIKKNFLGWEIEVDDKNNPMVIFPAVQKEVGNIFIHDDGDEITVFIEKISHGHFACYDTSITEREREAAITEDVIDFLQSLFADKVLLFTTADNRIGGWARLGLGKGPVQMATNRTYCLWSKPYTP